MTMKMQQMSGALLSLMVLTATGCTKTGDDEAVEQQVVAMQNSPKLSSMPSGNILAAGGEKVCLWNDKKYSDGATVCDAKIRYKCWTDKWVDIGRC